MNRQRHDRARILGRRSPLIGRAGSVVLLCTLAALAPTTNAGDNSISGFDQITLAPGDTGNCESSPCTVYMKMPAGTGSYTVMSSGNGRVGEYPAGETVNLGSFWSSQAFSIEGMDVPKAYAYIPNEP